MVKKILGYILAIIGIVGLVASIVPQIKTALAIPDIGDTNLMIASILLVAVGIFLALKMGGGKKVLEVPIYHGKNIVGYRRTK